MAVEHGVPVDRSPHSRLSAVIVPGEVLGKRGRPGRRSARCRPRPRLPEGSGRSPRARPASLRPPTSRSFGHFRPGVDAGDAAARVDGRASATPLRVPVQALRRVGVEAASTRAASRRAAPAQRRPSRPRPAVWWSATSDLAGRARRPGPRRRRSALVEPVSSTARARPRGARPSGLTNICAACSPRS